MLIVPYIDFMHVGCRYKHTHLTCKNTVLNFTVEGACLWVVNDTVSTPWYHARWLFCVVSRLLFQTQLPNMIFAAYSLI